MDMEEAPKLPEVPAEGRNRKKARRFTLQLGSMVAQWMVLLACVIGIGLCYLKVSPCKKPPGTVSHLSAAVARLAEHWLGR